MTVPSPAGDPVDMTRVVDPITDHPFMPKHRGIDEWKQLCIHIGDDGEICGRSEPNHKGHTWGWSSHG